MNRGTTISGRSVTSLVIAVIISTGCGAAPDDGDPEADLESLTSSCSFTTTVNKYDGPNWWGTISFKNNGPSSANGYKVDFDVPSGAHCTNDAVPSGATPEPSHREQHVGLYHLESLHVYLHRLARVGRFQNAQLLDNQSGLHRRIPSRHQLRQLRNREHRDRRFDRSGRSTASGGPGGGPSTAPLGSGWVQYSPVKMTSSQ